MELMIEGGGMLYELGYQRCFLNSVLLNKRVIE
jgi:hypothetical protein